MTQTEDFLCRWLGTVLHYSSLPPVEQEALVDRLLREGLPHDVPAAAAGDVTSDQRSDAEQHLVRASGWFDPFGYFWHNPDLRWDLCGHDEEVRHFVERGWKELRHPIPGFDLWFYWCEHLDPTRDDVNPLVHYLLEGRHRGYDVQPHLATIPPPPPPARDRAPRRVCLFAGYDVDGIVDETVVAYVAELSRFADVYYLADCQMPVSELAKLAPHTKGRWAIRHGRYDFGSYSMLARDLVGWQQIDEYDELLLVNDSGYLVQPLDTVFDRMDSTTCDWWGLQATYEAFGVHAHRKLGRPLRLDEMTDAMRAVDLWRYSDFVHVGSYFLAYRRRVHTDPEFRRRLDAVAPQSDKTQVILKYEIGFSRLLILAGYHLATFVDGVLPYHPVYRDSAFALMRDGFPVLKRQFIYENPFEQPDLHRWKERVLDVVPGADVAPMERNLLRVAPFWKLLRSFGFRTLDDGRVARPEALTADNFAEEERWLPRHRHWWVFVTDPHSGQLTGNARAVFEAVRHDGGVKKIVLHGRVAPRLGRGQNVEAVEAESAPGQLYAVRAGVVFVSGGPRADLNHPLSHTLRLFVMVGDPLAVLADDEVADVGTQHDLDLTRRVVVASPESAARARRRYPHLSPDYFLVTGAPRHDLLVRPEDQLPETMRAALDALRATLAGRDLVLVDGEPGRSATDLDGVAAALAEHLGPGVVVGLRRRAPGVADDPDDPEELAVDDRGVLGLSPTALPDVEVAWRLARAVVTDCDIDLADLQVTAAVGVRLGAPDLPGVVRQVLRQPPPRPSRGPLCDGRAGLRVVGSIKRTYLPIDTWLAEARPDDD